MAVHIILKVTVHGVVIVTTRTPKVGKNNGPKPINIAQKAIILQIFGV